MTIRFSPFLLLVPMREKGILTRIRENYNIRDTRRKGEKDRVGKGGRRETEVRKEHNQWKSVGMQSLELNSFLRRLTRRASRTCPRRHRFHTRVTAVASLHLYHCKLLTVIFVMSTRNLTNSVFQFTIFKFLYMQINVSYVSIAIIIKSPNFVYSKFYFQSIVLKTYIHNIMI